MLARDISDAYSVADDYRVDLELSTSLERRPLFPLHTSLDHLQFPRHILDRADLSASSLFG